MLNYYRILEIPDFSNELIIKRAYRTLSKKYHPDINNDPSASDYFIAINSAYEFLMDENKRLLLNQFLQANNHSKSQKYTTEESTSNSRRQRTQTTRQDYSRNIQPPPVVHNFSCDRSYFTLGDYILINWNVSQCKSVRVSLFGNVDFIGSEYYKIDTFSERLTITLYIEGLDGKEYTSEMALYYREENSYKKAYHKVLDYYPNADPKHFIKETFFETRGRLGKKEFQFRMVMLFSFLTFLFICYVNMNGKLILFTFFVALFWTIYQQLRKRTQDCKEYKHLAKNRFLPIWSISYFKGLLTIDSEPNDNEYGIIPEVQNISLWSWMSTYKGKFTWFDGLKIASSMSFVLLMIALLAKVNAQYTEQPIELKNTYFDQSIKRANPNIILVFEDGIKVEITQSVYSELTNSKEGIHYKVGIDSDNEVQYIKAFLTKTNEVLVFNFGILSNANPILIFIALLFIAHMFAMYSLKKQDELIYAKGIMIFILFLNIFIILQL